MSKVGTWLIKYTFFKHYDSSLQLFLCSVYILTIVRKQGHFCGLHVNIIEALSIEMNLTGNKRINEFLPTSIINITPLDVERYGTNERLRLLKPGPR